MHAFDQATADPISIKLPTAGWRIQETLHDATTTAPMIAGDELRLERGAAFRGWAVLLGR